jgi:hypothetical protein
MRLAYSRHSTRYLFGRQESKDVTHAANHRTSQTELPRTDILLDPRQRQGTTGGASEQPPADALRPEREHSVSRSGIWRAQASSAAPNRLAINGLAPSTSSAYRHAAGGAIRVLSVLSSLLFASCFADFPCCSVDADCSREVPGRLLHRWPTSASRVKVFGSGQGTCGSPRGGAEYSKTLRIDPGGLARGRCAQRSVSSASHPQLAWSRPFYPSE